MRTERGGSKVKGVGCEEKSVKCKVLKEEAKRKEPGAWLQRGPERKRTRIKDGGWRIDGMKGPG